MKKSKRAWIFSRRSRVALILVMLGVCVGLSGWLRLATAAEDVILELYWSTPDVIEEYSSVPITVTGVVPADGGIVDLSAAEAAYRVYIGVEPWTSENIAPFRVGEDGYVVTPYHSVYSNEIRVMTPAFSPPGWLSVEVMTLDSASQSARIYNAIAVVPYGSLNLEEDYQQELENIGGFEESGDSAGRRPQTQPVNNASSTGAATVGSRSIELSESVPLTGGDHGPDAIELSSLTEAWVEFGYIGDELGAYEYPFNTLAEGVDAIEPFQSVYFKTGGSDETLRITKPLTLQAAEGLVRIGDTSAHRFVTINEVLLDNASGLRDEDNTLQPWIELYNSSSNAISLFGWGSPTTPLTSTNGRSRTSRSNLRSI